MKKVCELSEKTVLTYDWGYVYSLQYHIIWCTKYRKKILEDGIDIQCKEMLEELAAQYSFRILAMEVMPDHIHLLLDHPELKKQLWGGHLWNPSYCAVTVSDRSCEQIKHYIDSQKER